jgi:hypothetical protein
VAGVPPGNVQFDVAIGSPGEDVELFVNGVALPTHTGGLVNDGCGKAFIVTGNVIVL